MRGLAFQKSGNMHMTRGGGVGELGGEERWGISGL